MESVFPADLVARLAAALRGGGAKVAAAASGERVHPVFALWPLSAEKTLARALAESQVPRAGDVLRRFRLAVVEFPCEPFDPFLNVNTPADLERARAVLRR